MLDKLFKANCLSFCGLLLIFAGARAGAPRTSPHVGNNSMVEIARQHEIVINSKFVLDPPPHTNDVAISSRSLLRL
ncbi:hypothetical protein PF008_g25163 [Phytophthora fragariae]|uniref:RxLR effector protein n=1 Tax=Phytophthora fragariae TaxID=53985 RepID=A0A6G0QKR8_9STRA|nr:hypothetical protein PF008_g25163 [Phytophthora fragariae]